MEVGLREPVKGTVVSGTSEYEDAVGVLDIPPCAGALESDVRDELVCRLDASAAEGIASLTRKAIVEMLD